MHLDDFIESLKIIKKYLPKAEIAAEHDVFYCGGYEELMEVISDEDENRLYEELGWFEQYDSNTHFI